MCGHTQDTKFRFPYIRTEMNVMFSSIIFHFVFDFHLFQNIPFLTCYSSRNILFNYTDRHEFPSWNNFDIFSLGIGSRTQVCK